LSIFHFKAAQFVGGFLLFDTGRNLLGQWQLQHVPTGVNRDSQTTPKERV
jgi:hypothetical protein